jgi:hypothetical protein
MHLPRIVQNVLGIRHPMSVRLWRGGGLVAVFFGTLLIGNLFVSREHAVTWDMLGHDFLPFYYGGTCARTGHYEQLFDLPATKAFEYKVGRDAGLSLGNSFGPWWNPPFAAWIFAPLSALPFLSALHAWWAISGVCLAVSIYLMCRMVGGGYQNKLLVPFLVLLAMPCFQVICHGQNTFFSLLLLTITVVLWRGGYSLFAGIVCGLLFYKPQLGLINVLTMPGSLHEFVYHMPLNLRWIEEQNPYRWERHVTFKSFWRLIFQSDSIGPMATIPMIFWFVSEIALVVALGAMLLRMFKSEKTPSARDRLISAAICAMPLLMPFYFDYDLLLISVGIVVYVADRQRAEAASNWEDRWLPLVWAALFLVLMLWKAKINPTVPLLAIAAGMLICRGLRKPAREVPAIQVPDFPRSLAA